MIFYGSSGWGSLGELLLLDTDRLAKPLTFQYLIYPENRGDRSVLEGSHRQAWGRASRLSFRMCRKACEAFLGQTGGQVSMLRQFLQPLSCLTLDEVLKGLRQEDKTQVTSFNVLNYLSEERGVTVRVRSESRLVDSLKDLSIDALHRRGFWLGGRVIYYLVSRICKNGRSLRILWPQNSKNSVRGFFPDSSLLPTGNLHIRVAGVAPGGWEPACPTIWTKIPERIQKQLRLLAVEAAAGRDISITAILDFMPQKVGLYREVIQTSKD